jgi:DNA-binding SARP family transcriptional activator/ABC-type glycerol-3-phosphate transport system substrate-binding protein
VEYRTLGTLAARDGTGPVAVGGHRQQLVLAVLLQHANEVVSTDRLVDAVWGASPPPTARKTLQVYVSRLRRGLGADAIVTVGDGYRLTVGPDAIDADRFRRLADEGRAALHDDPDLAAARLRRALALWEGTPWGRLGDEPALRASAERLRDRRLDAVEDRIYADLARGELQGLTGELASLIEEHPLRERLYALAMTAAYRQGRQADALDTYRRLRTRLSEELGIEPSPEVQRLHEAILRQDPGLGPTSAPADAPAADMDVPNPYRGLAPFTEADADAFFGREELVAALVERLQHDRVVTLTGPSGCGKSSIVRAGVAPALRTSDGAAWRVATMVPGAHPFEALEAAVARSQPAPLGGSQATPAPTRRGDDLDVLRTVLHAQPDDDGRLLLIVDQLEELFVLTGEQARCAFVANLIEAVEDPSARLTVLATVRADLLDRPLEEPGLAELVVAGLVSVPPLSPAQLEEAVVRPAASVGVSVEPELIAELVADVVQRPSALPLFQYALTVLFETRTGPALTLHGYQRIGGVRGAVARRADTTYERLDEDERAAAEQVFVRLVTIGAEDTRRRVRRAELESLHLDEATVSTVLDRFGKARLLSFDRDPAAGDATVEVAHEALLRAWPLLHGWTEQRREVLRLHRALADAAADWEHTGRDPDYLLGGSRLAVHDGWVDDPPLTLTRSEHAFLVASAEQAATAREEEARRHEHELALERRARNRSRALAAVLGLAAVVASVLTLVAVDQRRGAEGLRTLAQARQLTSTAVAIREADPGLSLLLTHQAVAVAQAIGEPVAADTVAALHWGLQAARVTYPVDPEAEAVVLDGPRGPQGVFVLTLPELLRLASETLDGRQLTAEECADYVGRDTVCPPLPGEPPDDLRWYEPASPREPSRAPLAGTSVRLLASDSEADAASELELLRGRTGIRLTFDQEDALEELVRSRALSGEIDLALVPQPALVAELGREGHLVDLTTSFDASALSEAYPEHLLTLGRVDADGTWPAAGDAPLYGVPHNVDLKSMIWYSIPAFEAAGYDVPTTWQELEALVERIEADGRVPWCHAEWSGRTSGWPGSDWIEDLVLQTHGPVVYDDWVRGDIAFSDAPIRDAFERFDALVLADGRVHGGRRGVVQVPFWATTHPLFDEPPGCWLAHGPSFHAGNLPFGVEPGVDAGWFPTPAVTSAGEVAVLGGGQFLVAFTDRPEVREVVRDLSGIEWGALAVGDGIWWFSANRTFPLDTFSDADSRELARLIHDALDVDAFRYDAQDMLGPELFNSFGRAMLDLAGEGREALETILAELDAVRVRVEG